MIEIEKIKKWLKEKKGVLVTKSAVVYREQYFGNDIIAENSSSHNADARGYVPVELWIMSTTEAENGIQVAGEGLTKINIFEESVSLADLKQVAKTVLFGDFSDSWPLTKILDIGGIPVETSFGTKETPPIPVHLHPEKTEAYFFPPTILPPYNKKISAITRIGLKKGVTKEDFKEKLNEFGKSDSMYTLLNEFPIEPMTGWTLPEKILHAPGPYITFEIQLPKDDYNMASWKLSERLDDSNREKKYGEQVLRGLKDEDEYIDKALNWELTTDQTLKDKYLHRPEIIESGQWGKRYQIFFDMFYGEGWEILPGQTMSLSSRKEPQAGIVWSGEGEINGNIVTQNNTNEFFCIPETNLSIKNTGSTILYIYTVLPIRKS